MGHLVEHRGDHGEWRIHMGTTGVGWVPRCSAYWWCRVDMEDSTQDALTRRVSGDHCGRMLWHMEETVHTIHRTLLRDSPWRVPCVRRCADAAGDTWKATAPKFQWMRQAEMAECWKYMVPKLTAAGVVDLSCCLPYEQFWQRCGDCRVKVLREGGETSMPAQVLHVTNQWQSVRQRVKEGMEGRPVGLPDPRPPCPCGSNLREAPMYTSFVFNEVVGLHVHNQQEYKLVVDHEFLDCLGWQWSLHAMGLHIGSTREEGHFLVYVVFNDKWWLCDDTAVKAMTPPPNPRKATFLVYKRKQTDLVVPDMSHSASQRTGPPALGQTRDAQRIPIDTSVPSMALAPGAPPPPSVTAGCIKGWVQEQAYACPERAYGLLCASHGAGTGCTPPFTHLQHRVHPG